MGLQVLQTLHVFLPPFVLSSIYMYKDVPLFTSYYSSESKHLTILTKDQRTNGPVNAHLISWPCKSQNIQNLENIR